MKIYAPEEIGIALQHKIDTLLTPTLQQARDELIEWGQFWSIDNWPEPEHVERFAKKHDVPERDLAALVGFLFCRMPGVREELWHDALRHGSEIPFSMRPRLTKSQLDLYSLFLLYLAYTKLKKTNVLLV